MCLTQINTSDNSSEKETALDANNNNKNNSNDNSVPF